jgi:hypothetical protein
VADLHLGCDIGYPAALRGLSQSLFEGSSYYVKLRHKIFLLYKKDKFVHINAMNAYRGSGG